MGMGKVMVGSASKVAFILLVSFSIIIPCLEAGIGEFDDWLKTQADHAHKLALDSYVPIPEEVAHELNVHVHMYVHLSLLLLFLYYYYIIYGMIY